MGVSSQRKFCNLRLWGPRSGGLRRRTFKMTDGIAVVERAPAVGATIQGEPQSAHRMTNLLVAVQRNPEGSFVAIVQPPA